jgi:hypothetical protein
MRQIAYLYVMLTSVLGQISQVPYEYESGLTNKQLTYSYKGSFSSIRKIDFRNFDFYTFDENGNPLPGRDNKSETHLANGHYKHQEPGDYKSLDLVSFHYLPKLPQSSGDSAVALLSWFGAGGSSNERWIAQVFTVSGGQLRVVQEIVWETEAEEGGGSLVAKTNTLVIRSDHCIPGDGYKYPSALDVVTLKWDGNRFVQEGIRTELSKYGKREGKRLPVISNQSPDQDH